MIVDNINIKTSLGTETERSGETQTKRSGKYEYIETKDYYMDYPSEEDFDIYDF